MSTEVTSTAFKAACAACADAIIAQDEKTAYIQYGVAEAIHAGLPSQAGHENSFMRRRESLAGLASSLEKVFKIVNRKSSRDRRVRARMGFR